MRDEPRFACATPRAAESSVLQRKRPGGSRKGEGHRTFADERMKTHHAMQHSAGGVQCTPLKPPVFLPTALCAKVDDFFLNDDPRCMH